MDIIAGSRQPRAVITTERARPDDRNAGIYRKIGTHNASVVTKLRVKYNPSVVGASWRDGHAYGFSSHWIVT
jgi:hypothetical protein